MTSPGRGASPYGGFPQEDHPTAVGSGDPVTRQITMRSVYSPPPATDASSGFVHLVLSPSSAFPATLLPHLRSAEGVPSLGDESTPL